ncbi:fructose-bisphosphate aldolase [Bacillus sp. AK128]
MRKLWMLLFLSFLLFFTTACNISQEPKITIEAVVSKLSEEEFDYFGTHGLDNPTKDDFRKFTFDFEVEHSTEIIRKVEFPERKSWKEAINTIDNNKDRYWFGEGNSQNNDSENFASYGSEFVFYSKGLSEEEIINAFNSIILELYLDTEEGESITSEYNVGDLIEFDTLN